MAVDYDLVVIGNSPEGRYAAAQAAQFHARVALVEQSILAPHHSYSQAIYSHTLATHIHHCLYPESFPHQWAQEVISHLQEQCSPTVLASLGVDVITGVGEFCRLPQQALVVNQRRLRSRAYLLATSSHFTPPNLPEIEQVGYLTLEDVAQKLETQSLPNKLVIVGSTPLAIELAQSLRCLSKEITLVVENQPILPTEDTEVAFLIQACLEAQGIVLITNSGVTQVKKINHTKWLQVGNRALETEEIIWIGNKQPNVAGLNLEGVGVKWVQNGVAVNSKLQTTNPQIYACGDLTGGYQFTHIAQHEANLALKNALFWPIFTVNYQSIPWVIFSQPNLARVGMTESQARHRYGNDVIVVRKYVKNLPSALLQGQTTGLCKLIVRRNGAILGAHMVSQNAGEVISAIAVAMKQKIKLGQLADVIFATPTWSEMIKQIAQDWRKQRWQRHKNLRNCLENWFDWQRDWTN